MGGKATFLGAFPYLDNVLGLPVTDLDEASKWYCEKFGMREIERREGVEPSVILERDGIRIGFSINGGDPTQAGAAILIKNWRGMRKELVSQGVTVSEPRVDDRPGRKFEVFFVVAPDGLCFYFHEPLEES